MAPTASHRAPGTLEGEGVPFVPYTPTELIESLPLIHIHSPFEYFHKSLRSPLVVSKQSHSNQNHSHQSLLLQTTRKSHRNQICQLLPIENLVHWKERVFPLFHTLQQSW